MNKDLLISIDPSSTRTGYCVMDHSERIKEAGILSGKRRAEPETRIAAMAKDLMVLLNRWQPGTAVIEITSGKVNKRRHFGRGAGLSILGLSIGRLWGQIEAWRLTLPIEDRNRLRVVLIRENRWIEKRTKTARQQAVALTYPGYDPTEDSGADVSDAISLATWYLRENKIRAVGCGT